MGGWSVGVNFVVYMIPAITPNALKTMVSCSNSDDRKSRNLTWIINRYQRKTHIAYSFQPHGIVFLLIVYILLSNKFFFQE